MLREVVAEPLHLLLAGAVERHIGNLMETDEVDVAVEPFEQPADGLGMGLAVVDAAEDDVFERQSALVGEVVVAQQFHHILDSHTAFGRHQFGALLVEWGVQADGHLAQALVEEAAELVFQSHRTHGDALRAPRPTIGCGENLGGPQHVVEVVHRLALTHEDDVGQFVDLRQTVDLIENVGRREVTLEALLTRLTEEAVHLAPHLARDAERGMTAFLGNEDRLDELRPRLLRLSGAYREEIFDGAVFGMLRVDRGHGAYLISLFQLGPVGF